MSSHLSLIRRLSDISKLHRQVINELLSDIGLFAGQERLLFQLWEKEGYTQSDLAELLGVSAATITKMINRLMKNDLITKKRDARDSRIYRIYLTGKGRALEQKTYEIYDKYENILLGDISTVEIDNFEHILELIQDNLNHAV